jgi:hypothetical protein
MFSSVVAEVPGYLSLTIPAHVAHQIVMARQRHRYSDDHHLLANHLADQKTVAEYGSAVKLNLLRILATLSRSFWQPLQPRLVLPL